MSNETGGNSRNSSRVEKLGDGAKLASILALAGGAVAMPQSGAASVTYSNLPSPAVVGFGPGDLLSYSIPLPSAGTLGIARGNLGGSTRVVAATGSGGSVKIKTSGYFAIHIPGTGKTWSQLGGDSNTFAPIGYAKSIKYTDPFGPDYLAFRFKNTSQTLCYGWLRVTLENSDLLTGDGPEVFVHSYAYDDSGVVLPMGQVPEPSSAALLTLGALTLGARGVRTWRRNRSKAD